MQESRTRYVKKNIYYGYVCTLLTSILSFVSRSVFIGALGVDYLGISGIFTNVLGILSFSELGIGTAISFSLYKPIAENDREKIKSLMNFYRAAYRVIALIVTVSGVILYPFLKYLVNSPIPLEEINTYYWVFLFNTVSSYFVSYKTSFASAIQKNYIVTIADSVSKLVIEVTQIILLKLGGRYMGFLLVAAGIGLVKNIITVLYLNRKYPVLTEKDRLPLDEDTKKGIWKNVKALIVHKIGDVAVNQTDNLIISTLISTTMVGYISNYVSLHSMVASFTTALFAGSVASIGNMLVKAGKKRWKEVFEVYDLLSFWVFGFVLVAFLTLSQSFITLWVGEALRVDDLTMILFFVSKYLEGLCVITHHFKAAAGRFEEDKWVPFAQAVINLVTSVAAVRLIGLPGVYVGTILQRLLVNYMRPHIVYKCVLQADEKEYFVRFFFRLVLLTAVYVLMRLISRFVLSEVTVIRFALMALLTAVIPNALIVLIYYRTPAFKELMRKVFGKSDRLRGSGHG